MNETIKFWLKELYEHDIQCSMETISNERIWAMGSDTEEECKMHYNNIAQLEEYIKVLEALKEEI